MGFQIGSRRRKNTSKTTEEGEEKGDKKGRKKLPKSERIDSRPPPTPGSAMKQILSVADSARTDSTTTAPSQSTTISRSVLFRDNRLTDGSPVTALQHPHQSHNRDCQRRVGSPTGSINSNGSAAHIAYPSFASYPASYLPKTEVKKFNAPSVEPSPVYSNRARGEDNEHDDDGGPLDSIYAHRMPKPDYPLSSENFNRDSGLDSESRSSSGEAKRQSVDQVAQKLSQIGCAGSTQPSSLRLRPFRQEEINAMCTTSRTPQPEIHRPRSYQRGHETASALSCRPPPSSTALINLNSRFRKTPNFTPLPQTVNSQPRLWIGQPEDPNETNSYYFYNRTHSVDRRDHCSSCSCSGEVVQRHARPASSLQRIQLEDRDAPDWGSKGSCSVREGRRFRREDNCPREVSLGSLRTLPRNQPIRGRFFEHLEQTDRYGRLPPVRRPVTSNLLCDLEDNCDDGNDEDYDDDEASSRYGVHHSPIYSSGVQRFDRRPLPSSFYQQRDSASRYTHDRSVIKL